MTLNKNRQAIGKEDLFEAMKLYHITWSEAGESIYATIYEKGKAVESCDTNLPLMLTIADYIGYKKFHTEAGIKLCVCLSGLIKSGEVSMHEVTKHGKKTLAFVRNK